MKIKTFIKKEWRKQYICWQKRINHDKYWYHVKQFFLASACNFHILLIYYVYTILSIGNFHTVLSMFPFLFYWSHLKTGVHSCNSSLFRKMSIIGQSNVPARTAKNDEQYFLNKITYIGFQNSYSFLSRFPFCVPFYSSNL